MTEYSDDQISAQYFKTIRSLEREGYTKGVVELLRQAEQKDTACMQELLRRGRRRSRPYEDREATGAAEMCAGLLMAAEDEFSWHVAVKDGFVLESGNHRDPQRMINLKNTIAELAHLNPHHELVELYQKYNEWEWLPYEIARRFRPPSSEFANRPHKPTATCFANMLNYAKWIVRREQHKQACLM